MFQQEPTPLMPKLRLKEPVFVILNGPSRSGKDTAARAIAYAFGQFNPIYTPLAKPLKETVHHAFQTPFRRYDAYENCKDQPHADFNGKTPAECYIDFAENFFKPRFGHDIYGKLLVKAVKEYLTTKKMFIITDNGFEHELIPLALEYGARCLFIRLYRNDCAYTTKARKDSRSYVYPEKSNIPELQLMDVHILENNGTKEVLSAALTEIVASFLGRVNVSK